MPNKTILITALTVVAVQWAFKKFFPQFAA